MSVMLHPNVQRHYLRVILALALLSSLAALRPALAAQNQTISLAVRAGYDGVYQTAEWFPIDIRVTNDGPDLRGMLEWSFPAQPDETIFRRAIELPRGARKRITMYAFSRGFARNGQVRLLDGTNILAEQTIQLDAADSNIFLVGVISSDPTLMNSLNSLQISGTAGAAVRHLDLDLLPEQSAALAGLSAIFLHDMDTSTIRPEQRSALETWVQTGGQLIVSGGLNATRAAAGLESILPVELSGGLVQGNLAGLNHLVGGGASGSSATTLSEVRLRPGAERLPPDPNGSNAAPLIVRHTLGNGSVAFTTFDLASLRSWSGEVTLWQNLLNPIIQFAPATNARLSRSNLLQSVLQLPSLNLPSVELLLLLLVVYLVAIGPVNYMVLRRLGRLEWAWLTVPGTVALFAASFYLIGFSLRGGQLQLNQVAVVQALEGQQRGLATSFIGLFSPRRTRYSMSLQPDALVSETRGWNDENDQVAEILNSDTAVQIPDVLIDVASVRTMMAEAPVDSPLQVQSTIRNHANGAQGQIRNAGDTALEDVLIVHGNVFQALGTIGPGQTGQVEINDHSGNFPWGVAVSDVGPFNRQQMLSSLFGNDSVQRTLDEQGVYLLAWRNRPLIPVQINGQEASQQGLTLYVIRLQNS